MKKADSSPSYRQTKIIATLGPATESKEQISALIKSGVDVMRLNMAHASHQWVADIIWHIREVASNVGRQVAVMMDVKGPEIRTGPRESPLPLSRGDTIFLCTEVANKKNPGHRVDSIERVLVNYAGLPHKTLKSAQRFWSTVD